MKLKEKKVVVKELSDTEICDEIAQKKSEGVNIEVITPIIAGIIFVAILLIAIILQKGGNPTHINVVIAIGVIIAALGFDFINGMNDSSNSVATVISTHVMSPISAIIMAAIFNFIGAMVFEGVAKNIATKMVSETAIDGGFVTTPLMIFCGLIGAVAWSYFMSIIGIPISMSHCLIGGIVGVLFMVGGKAILNIDYFMSIIITMFTAPLAGFIVGLLVMVLVMWIFYKANSKKVGPHFRFWQIISAAYMSFMHGANDAQKAMGIITMALVAAGMHAPASADGGVGIPVWVKISCAVIIGLGTAIGGQRVIKTLGTKIFKINPVHGCVIQTVSAGIIHYVTHIGIPLSTTHVLTASILGVGSSKRFSAVRWGVAGNIVFAWIFTIPTCGIAAAVLYWLVKFTGLE